MNKSLGSKIIVLFAILIVFTPVFATSSADWSSPENLSDWQVYLGSTTWVLVGKDGTQGVFWMQSDLDTMQESLWVRVRQPGGDWSPAQNIFGWQGFTVFPQIVVTPDNTLWTVWMMQDETQVGSNWQVKAASWSGSGPWQVEVLSEYETTIRNIDLAVGPGGHLAATWVACATLVPYDQGPCVVNIRRRSPAAAAWEQIERVDDSSQFQGIRYGRSLVGLEGLTVTTWAQASWTTAGQWHVMSCVYDPGTDAWELVPTDISKGGISSNVQPFLAQPIMGADGTVIVAWYKQDPGDSSKADLYSVTRSASTGTWNNPVSISDVHDAALLNIPLLAVGQDGTAVAAWEQKNNLTDLDYAVFASVRDPGLTWGPPVRVSEWMDTLDLAPPQVWMDGSSMLLWNGTDMTQLPPKDEGVFWTARPPGGEWGYSGYGQLGSYFDSIKGISLGSSGDGKVTVLWGVLDSDQPVDQQAKVLSASWLPAAAIEAIDTLSTGYMHVDISADSLAVSGDGQVKAAAWRYQKSVAGPTIPNAGVFHSQVLPANSSPTATFAITPSSGSTHTSFLFDASGSSDNEDPSSALEVRWDWEDNGTFDTNWSTTKTENHQYSAANTYQVRLQVQDSGGLIDSVTKQLDVTSNGGGGTVALQVFVPIVIR